MPRGAVVARTSPRAGRRAWRWAAKPGREADLALVDDDCGTGEGEREGVGCQADGLHDDDRDI